MEWACVQQFSPEPVNTAAVRWGRWLRRLKNFIATKDIKDSNQKKAMLLHYAREEMFVLVIVLAFWLMQRVMKLRPCSHTTLIRIRMRIPIRVAQCEHP